MTIKIWLSGTLLRISDDDNDYHVVAHLGEGEIRVLPHRPEGIVLTGNMLYQALKHLNGIDEVCLFKEKEGL